MSEPTDPFPDPSITASVGGPWPVDPTVYELPTAQGVPLGFQWRERGAVLHLPSGTMALADARFPVPAPAPPPPGGSSSAAQLRGDIIATAMSYAGTPYGMPPGPGEVDCSSYVLEVYAAVELAIPNCRTAEQIRQQCDPIPWDAVQPGDLLFFVDTYDVTEPPGPDGYAASHIGISLGAGTYQMWNAVEPVVTCSDIGTDYWQGHLLEARVQPALAALEGTAPATAQVEAIDVSNYQPWATGPARLASYMATLSPQPTRVIVRLASYLEPAHLRITAIAQLQAATALYPDIVHSLGCYGWMYRQADPRTEVDYWHAQIIEALSAPLYEFWLDVEDGANCPTDAQILTELELLEGLGYHPGVYTGKFFWDDHFARCDPAIYQYPAWIANYSTDYTLDTVPLPHGWTQAQGHQYTSDPCDRNVFRS